MARQSPLSETLCAVADSKAKPKTEQSKAKLLRCEESLLWLWRRVRCGAPLRDSPTAVLSQQPWLQLPIEKLFALQKLIIHKCNEVRHCGTRGPDAAKATEKQTNV